MSIFGALAQAPTEGTPEKATKKADTRKVIEGHFGPVNHPLKPGQQPNTYCILRGLSRKEQSALQSSEIKTYGQNGPLA